MASKHDKDIEPCKHVGENELPCDEVYDTLGNGNAKLILLFAALVLCIKFSDMGGFTALCVVFRRRGCGFICGVIDRHATRQRRGGIGKRGYSVC